MSNEDLDWGNEEFEDNEEGQAPAPLNLDAKEQELSQFEALCDSFDYDPREFKEVKKPSSKMTRFEEDAISTGFENLPKNRVNQLGLGPKILDLKRRGFTLAAIAERFDLSQREVKVWWDTFQSLAPKQKQVFAKVMNEHSIFNMTARIEEAFAELRQIANEVRNNPELWVIYSGQILNYLKFAKDLIQALKLDQQREEEMNIVIEHIKKMDPKTAMSLVKELQAHRATKNLFGG